MERELIQRILALPIKISIEFLKLEPLGLQAYYR